MYQFRSLMAVGISLTALTSAHAFGGEDFITLTINNWHHADISCRGAAGVNCGRLNDGASSSIRGLGAGFTTGAAASICWHADYVDSYGYNPLWWVPGGMSRLKAALSCKPEITKVHFDDLVTRRFNQGSAVFFEKLPYSRLKLLDQVRSTSSLTARGDLIGAAMKDISLDSATYSALAKATAKANVKAPTYKRPPISGVGLAQVTDTVAKNKEFIGAYLAARPPRNAAELQMRRYLTGTIDGLIYAESTSDVAAAHHILGVSLHAIQDFYSHSNWIDEPARRNKTYFDMATSEWSTLGSYSLYTGSYETPTQTGIISHGKYAPACTIMNQPGISQLLSVGCGAFSPIASEEVCLQYKACKQGKTLAGASVVGVTIPAGVAYFAPPGINLDSKWGAEIGARERNIVAPDFTARQAYDTAEALAIKATEQWIRRVGLVMTKLGKGAFWNRVMTENSVGSYTNPSREAINQWEDFSKLGYQFVSAGTYPPKATDPIEEHFLRLRISTARDANSGTDADIVVKANGQEFLLDNMPTKGDGLLKKAISYNDFEKGDDNVYLVGPFKTIPTSFTIENRSKTVVDVLVAIVEAFVKAIIDIVTSVVDGIIKFFKAIIGYDPDFVAKGQQVWRYRDLPANIGESRNFSMDLNGGDEGHYVLHGQIRKTADFPGQGGGEAMFVVRVSHLRCITESDWDRASNSDEPFLATFVNALDGEIPSNRRKLFGPFDDVDKGETRAINFDFPAVIIPKGAGVITFPVMLMESDDETQSERNDILNKFAGDTDNKARENNVWDTIGAALAPGWKVSAIQAWTFSKGEEVRSGRSGYFSNVGWIEGKESRTFNLSTPPALGILAADLENMQGVTLSASESPRRPLLALLGLTLGASLLGLGLVRAGRGR